MEKCIIGSVVGPISPGLVQVDRESKGKFFQFGASFDFHDFGLECVDGLAAAVLDSNRDFEPAHPGKEFSDKAVRGFPSNLLDIAHGAREKGVDIDFRYC